MKRNESNLVVKARVKRREDGLHGKRRNHSHDCLGARGRSVVNLLLLVSEAFEDGREKGQESTLGEFGGGPTKFENDRKSCLGSLRSLSVKKRSAKDLSPAIRVKCGKTTRYNKGSKLGGSGYFSLGLSSCSFLEEICDEETLTSDLAIVDTRNLIRIQ